MQEKVALPPEDTTQETKQETNDKDLRDVAAAAQIYRRKELRDETLNFVEDLDALDAALASDNIVARFAHPNGTDSIDFEMRPLTPGEMTIYYDTLLGHTLLEAIAGNPPDPEADGNPPDPDADGNPILDLELDAAQAQQLEDALAIKKYDAKLLNIVEGCILSPPGVTAARMRNWHPFYVQSLHNALMAGSRPSKQVARFPDMEPATRE